MAKKKELSTEKFKENVAKKEEKLEPAVPKFVPTPVGATIDSPVPSGEKTGLVEKNPEVKGPFKPCLNKHCQGQMLLQKENNYEKIWKCSTCDRGLSVM